jgi:AAA domain
VNAYELEKYYNFDISLFERMVMNRKGCVTLQVQHRMAPEIANLIVPTIYEKLKNHKSVLSRPSVQGLLKRLYFLSHSHLEMQVYIEKVYVWMCFKRLKILGQE